jgi:hypothetical protein
MTNKINLLLATPSLNCVGNYQKSLWEHYFNIVSWEQDKKYNSADTVLMVDYVNYKNYQDYGLKVVVDHLWDSAVDQPCQIQNNELTLRSADWIWIVESWMGHSRGYNIPRGINNPKKFFLMPMYLRRNHRDQLLERANDYLGQSLWSYVQQGHLLPGDAYSRHEPGQPLLPGPGRVDDRKYLPEWYADTCFSLVSETAVDTDQMGLGIDAQKIFISEKSFKPLAFQHPFIIQGTKNTLAFLQSRGFETFRTVINESYDTFDTADLRLDAIDQILKDLYREYQSHGSVFQTPEVQKILQHNYQRFWDKNIVHELFKKQIVDVITEFVES